MKIKMAWLVILLSLLLFGCGAAARQSEFYQHDTMYADWEHLKYSWWGYKNPTAETVNKSKTEGWWGEEQVIVVPAK